MKRYGVLVVGALAAAVCTRLGFWQLERLGERRAVNAEAVANLDLPPIDLTDRPTALPPDRVSYRRAAARGVFDFERQVIVMARSERGIPAVHVVTPLLLSDGEALLVERGFARSPDGRTVDLAAVTEPESTLVEGVLLPPVASGEAVSGDGWPVYVRRAEPSALAHRYPYRLRPQVLRRTTLTNVAGAGLRGLELPERSDGPHLSYAIQWFAFALIAIVGSGVLFRTEGRRGANGERGEGRGGLGA